MGSSSGSKSIDVPYHENPDGYFVQQPFIQDVAPAAPGQLDRLAEQLSTGYGGGQQPVRQHLDNLYRPMQVPDYAAAQRARMAGQPMPGAGQAAGAPTPAGQPMDPDLYEMLVSMTNPRNGR